MVKGTGVEENLQMCIFILEAEEILDIILRT